MAVMCFFESILFVKKGCKEGVVNADDDLLR